MKNKMNSKHTIVLALVLSGLMFLSSCEREIDRPDGIDIPIGNVLTISDLAQIFTDSGTYKFTEDFTFYATVTADKIGGNFYKNIFCEDSTAAVNVRTLADGGLYVGDYFRVNLKGSTVSRYAGLLQLDSVDVNKQVVIQANGLFWEPRVVTIAELNTNTDLIGRLVTLEEVEFQDGEIGNTYANSIGTSAQNRMIQDCNGNSVIVRTSDFASFAGTSLPTRNGSLTAIASVFNADHQLLVRKASEVEFTELRCDGSTGEYIMVKNFEDLSLTSGGWTQQTDIGTTPWTVSFFSGNNFAKVTNWNGTANSVADVWFISPALDLSATAAPALSFMTMTNYTGPGLETYISTDFVSSGSNVSNATWTLLQANYSPGSWAETQSGVINLTPFISASTTIAYRYQGGASSGATWEVDDIYVFDN